MGPKDTLMHKNVCVKALFSSQKRHNASELLYLVSFLFRTKYLHLYRTLRAGINVAIFGVKL